MCFALECFCCPVDTQTMSPSASSFRRVSSTTSRLIESYCSDCGLFIASSPTEEIIELMERLHQCQAPLPEMSRESIEALLQELARKEQQLVEWIQTSERNTQWFAKDPMSAIRAANLGLNENILQQLEFITASIAKKLRSAN